MAEGLIYTPVKDALVDAALRSLAVDFLLSNRDREVKILMTQIEYSSRRGYTYQVSFEENGNEEGLLEISYDLNNQPVVREI